ncbi:uncharacterized protein LOC113464588 [Ceratina calcarata]|uniref:Uncharacterized protein LOC113464588 n=1 Tax=Ceratina calcarata TaxID=156304 RepID=A0AAJ7S3Y0_9HYME|nr:uncharacterized protein LOC113464588 [Ceratina calcarata]
MNRPFSRDDNEPVHQVAIVPVDFPDRVFSHAEAEEFGDALNECVVNYTEARKRKSLGFVRPSFLSFFRKNGGFLMSCEDEVTVKWLKVAIKFVKLTSGCKLKVDDTVVLDNRFLVEGRGSHSRFTGANIIRNLQRFNNDLDVSRWRLVREKHTRSGLIITLEMEGRSVGMIRRKRNRLSLDQAGVHRFTILTVVPASNVRPPREPVEIEVTEDDFDANQLDPVEVLADEAGAMVRLNDSANIEEVLTQKGANCSFDAAGDEFILSADLQCFDGMEVEVPNESVVNTNVGPPSRNMSTPVRSAVTMEEGFSHGKEKVKGKQDLKETSVDKSVTREGSADSTESVLRISLPLEEPTEPVPPPIRMYAKKEGGRNSHGSGHNKSKGDRSSKR